MVKKRVIKQDNRGLYKQLWEEIQKLELKGKFDTTEFSHMKNKKGKPYTALQLYNGLDYLAKAWKVILPRDENKMWSTKPNGEIPSLEKKKRKSPRRSLEIKPLYDLLDAMAAAEPPIRQMIKNHERLQKFLKEELR